MKRLPEYSGTSRAKVAASCIWVFLDVLLIVVAVVAAPSRLAGLPRAQAGPAQAVRGSSPTDDPQQLVRDMVWNETEGQKNDHSLWRYRELQEDDGGPRRLLDVIHTREGQIHRVLAVNGQPLTGKELATEDNRIQKILSNPRQIRENQKKRQQDENEEIAMMNSLPDAFIFRKEGQQGSSVKLAFTPNPNFHPTTHATEVFHHMVGTLLIDRDAKRLVEIDGRLTSKVKFGGGLLGHLDEGGTFHVHDRNIGAGHWDIVFLDVHMDGKALFFKTISVRQHEEYLDYHQLPGNFTLQQAAEELQKDTNSTTRFSGD